MHYPARMAGKSSVGAIRTAAAATENPAFNSIRFGLGWVGWRLPGLATGPCACGFGVKTHANEGVLVANAPCRAPFTQSPGHMAQSPDLPPSPIQSIGGISPAVHINCSPNQSGDRLCGGQGGARRAGGGHVAKSIARLIAATSVLPSWIPKKFASVLLQPASILEPRIVGFLRRLTCLAQGGDAHGLQQRNQPQPYLGGHHRITQRGVTPQYGHIKALGNRLKTV